MIHAGSRCRQILLTQEQTDAQSEELQAVLSSETFSEALALSRLLRYLGEHYFDENRTPLNEYRIGVESLGRPADFDPAKNSCVRVEIHRLRSRLKRYYETEGAAHTHRVMLKEGRYELRIVQIQNETVVSPSDPNITEAPVSQPSFPLDAGQPPIASSTFETPSSELPKRTRPLAVILLVVVALCALYWGHTKRSHARLETSKMTVLSQTPIAPATEGKSILILAGSNQNAVYIDHNGRSWGGDRYFKGGDVVSTKLPYIQGTKDSIVYETARQGEFSYDIPAPPGKYELHLHFTEAHFGLGTYAGRGESSRIFSVFLNERPLLTHFDIFSDAGGNFRAFERVFKGVSPSGDGKIHLRFVRELDQPLVNAIELDPQQNDGMNPVRIVMQDSPYVDHAGRTWQSDQYAIGGLLATHRNPVTNAEDPHLYDGERFGHFVYQIPVAVGRYSVTMHFTESFFGSEDSAYAESSRIFDIYANGIALVRNFNIEQKAGGPNKMVSETFHGIEPNAAGLLVLDFVPDKNYACISSIEVTDDAR